MESEESSQATNYNLYFARGHGVDELPGNKYYRQLINQYCSVYKHADNLVDSSDDKRNRKREIVEEIIRSMVVRGAKFFHTARKTNNEIVNKAEQAGHDHPQHLFVGYLDGWTWKEIQPTDKYLLTKVRQSLRDTYTYKQRESNNGQEIEDTFMSSQVSRTASPDQDSLRNGERHPEASLQGIVNPGVHIPITCSYETMNYSENHFLTHKTRDFSVDYNGHYKPDHSTDINIATDYRFLVPNSTENHEAARPFTHTSSCSYNDFSAHTYNEEYIDDDLVKQHKNIQNHIGINKDDPISFDAHNRHFVHSNHPTERNSHEKRSHQLQENGPGIYRTNRNNPTALSSASCPSLSTTLSYNPVIGVKSLNLNESIMACNLISTPPPTGRSETTPMRVGSKFDWDEAF